MTSWCPLCQGVCRVLVLVRAQMFIRKQMNFSPHVHHHLDWSVVVMSLTDHSMQSWAAKAKSSSA